MRAFAWALAASVVAAHVARAQGSVEPRVEPEVRVDAVAIQSRVALQLGGGVQIPLGYYTRVGVIAAAGADLARFEQDASGRVDVIARFLFDPFRQSRWGVSAGGGVSVRGRTGEGLRPFIVAVVDVEGPRSSRGFSPAFQLGLGGGVRAGAALRWGRATAR